jgi:hypothetical protein
MMFIKSILSKATIPKSLLLLTFMACVALLMKYPWKTAVILRYGFGTTIAFLAIIYILIYSQQNRTGFLIGLISTILIYWFTLLSLWKNGFGEMQVLGGGIFFSDTFLFFSESNSLMDGGTFYSIASRRPLFAGFFSSILFLTSRNLQFSLILLVAINAIAIYLIGEEVKKTEGVISATLVCILLFLFYRRFVGTPDTENYGMVFGLVGFALLLTTAGDNQLIKNLFGLFLITLALLGRAGAFFVLIGILVWMISNEKTAKAKITIFGLSMLIILTGFLSNFVLSKVMNETSGTLFANYSTTIYGISVGGKGWEQAYRDHPELVSVPETVSSKILYRLALLNMYEHPFLTLQSVLHSWVDFFSLKNESVFGFASGGELIFRNIVDLDKNRQYAIWRILLYGLSIAGLIKCWKNHQDLRYKLILFCLLGTFLSVPFLPPRDSALMRVYAGTILPIIIIPAIGVRNLFLPISRVKAVTSLRAPQWELSGKISAWLGVFLVIAALLGPIFIKQFAYLPDFASSECSDSSTSVIVRVIPGAVVNIVTDSQPSTVLPLSIKRTTFMNSIEDFPQKEYILPLKKLTPPVAIANVFDVQTREYFWIIIHNNLYIRTPRIIAACGLWNQELAAHGLRFFETKDMYILQE